MSRRQDKPQKDKKPKAEKPQPKPKETPEQMRHRIRLAFMAAYKHEDE